MLKKLRLTFSVVLFFFLNISFLKADLLIPNNSILPAEVVKIQLVALMNNDKEFKDSGIEPLTPRSRRLGDIGKSTPPEFVI